MTYTDFIVKLTRKNKNSMTHERKRERRKTKRENENLRKDKGRKEERKDFDPYRNKISFVYKFIIFTGFMQYSV
jgi:hypothetical protein